MQAILQLEPDVHTEVLMYYYKECSIEPHKSQEKIILSSKTYNKEINSSKVSFLGLPSAARRDAWSDKDAVARVTTNLLCIATTFAKWSKRLKLRARRVPEGK